MSPRADQPPRRGVEPRRGASRDVPAADERDDDKGRGFGGIGDARAYTPRGRTVAERDQRTRSPRAGRNADPFRPALQVLDGGQPAARGGGRAPDEPEAPPRSRGRLKDEPEAPPRSGGRLKDEPEAPPRSRGRLKDEPEAPPRSRGRLKDEPEADSRAGWPGEREGRSRSPQRRQDDTDSRRGRPAQRGRRTDPEAELDRADARPAGRERPVPRAGRIREPEPARARAATPTLACGTRFPPPRRGR